MHLPTSFVIDEGTAVLRFSCREGKQVTITDVVVHPDYAHSENDTDIALYKILYVCTPVSCAKGVQNLTSVPLHTHTHAAPTGPLRFVTALFRYFLCALSMCFYKIDFGRVYLFGHQMLVVNCKMTWRIRTHFAQHRTCIVFIVRALVGCKKDSQRCIQYFVIVGARAVATVLSVCSPPVYNFQPIALDSGFGHFSDAGKEVLEVFLFLEHTFLRAAVLRLYRSKLCFGSI